MLHPTVNISLLLIMLKTGITRTPWVIGAEKRTRTYHPQEQAVHLDTNIRYVFLRGRVPLYHGSLNTVHTCTQLHIVVHNPWQCCIEPVIAWHILPTYLTCHWIAVVVMSLTFSEATERAPCRRAYDHWWGGGGRVHRKSNHWGGYPSEMTKSCRP